MEKLFITLESGSPSVYRSDMWIAALSLSGEPYLKYASRFEHSLLLASLMSSTEIVGLQDRSLVKADWNMPSPVKFQLYRLVSFFGIQRLPKQDSTSC